MYLKYLIVIKVLTQDVNKCQKNVEIEKNIFSQHVAWRTFIQIWQG